MNVITEYFMNISKTIGILLLTSLGIFSILASGGGSSSDESGGSSGTVNLTIPQAIVMVVDSAEKPLPFAQAGEDFTDSNGVAQGDVTTSASGWLRVSAEGYADAFTHTVFDPDFVASEQYLAILTRFQSMVVLHNGEQGTLDVNGNIHLDIDANELMQLPAQVAAAEINPYIIGPLYAGLSPAQDLNLQAAFAIQANDLSGQAVALQNGITLGVSLNDGKGMDVPPVLAWFDENSGKWLVIPNACSRMSSDMLNCQVDRFAALFGLFTNEPVDYTTAPAARLELAMPGSAQRLGEEQGASAGVLAANHVSERLQDMQDEGNVDLGDAELNDALDDMWNAANDYANSNRNEKGKTALMQVAEAASALGNSDMANNAIDEAADISREMAQDLLNANCERYKEAMHVAQQNFMLGNNDIAEQLVDHVNKDLADCDVWVGSIDYWLHVSGSHPSSIIAPDMSRVSGASSWFERHKVTITTNPKTLSSHGEDEVSLEFPMVKYENTDQDCEQSISFSGSGGPLLTFSGTYDGHTFAMGDVSAAGAGGIMTQTQVMESKIDQECEVVTGFPLTLNYPHFSFLAHSVASPSPQITIQEMLETGINHNDEQIRGSEPMINDNPDLGTYPFLKGDVTWKFFRVNKILPLGE